VLLYRRKLEDAMYINLRASDLAADPENATHKCGQCGALYAVAESMWKRSKRCTCGSPTLYPMNAADVTSGKATALPLL
jgi:hypothetical protein